MKIAIFSDIHGNDIAFESAVNNAKSRGATEFIIAGDLVSDYPLSSQVIQRARSLTKNIIKGNRESYFQKYYSSQDTHWKDFKQFAGMLWSFSHMKNDDFMFINSLPENIELNIDDLSFFVTHYVKDVDTYIPKISQNILVCGHVHKPIISKYDSKLYINAGSVGVNMSIGFNAEYILVDYTNGKIDTQIVHIPFDDEALKDTLDDKALINDEDALKTGLNYYMQHKELVKIIYRIYLLCLKG